MCRFSPFSFKYFIYHCIKFYLITFTWYCITLQKDALHYLHLITWHWIIMYFIALKNITYYYITLHFIDRICIMLHYNTLHYYTLCYIALHYITQHKTTLFISQYSSVGRALDLWSQGRTSSGFSSWSSQL